MFDISLNSKGVLKGCDAPKDSTCFKPRAEVMSIVESDKIRIGANHEIGLTDRGKMLDKKIKKLSTKERFNLQKKQLKTIKVPMAKIGKSQGSLDFKAPKVVLFLGKPNRGKTYAMKHMILENTLKKDGFQFGMVYSGSVFNDDYKWVDDGFVHSGWDIDHFVNWVDKLRSIRMEKGEPVKNFIVFDDLVSRIPLGCAAFNNFICNHRHYGTSVFISCQYLLRGTSPTFRECVSYAIIFNTKAHGTLQVLYEVFGQLFESFKDFKKFFLKATASKYTAVFYDQDEDNITNNYLSYKAPAKLPDIKLDFT